MKKPTQSKIPQTEEIPEENQPDGRIDAKSINDQRWCLFFRKIVYFFLFVNLHRLAIQSKASSLDYSLYNVEVVYFFLSQLTRFGSHTRTLACESTKKLNKR